jgi:hypothetical protein
VQLGANLAMLNCRRFLLPHQGTNDERFTSHRSLNTADALALSLGGVNFSNVMAFGKKTVHSEQFYLFLKQETNLTPTKEWLGIQGLSKVPLV